MHQNTTQICIRVTLISSNTRTSLEKFKKNSKLFYLLISRVLDEDEYEYVLSLIHI